MKKKKKSVAVLLVEDSPALVQAATYILEQRGCTVHRCASVKQAKSILASTAIDVVWLDHYLLGTEYGISLLTFMRSHEDKKIATIPVFLVSNTVSPDKVQQYVDQGIESYCLKASNRLDEIATKMLEVV